MKGHGSVTERSHGAQPLSPSDLEDSGPCGVLKQGPPRGRRFLKACSMSLASEDGSILQKEPLPGSSCDLATLMKYRLSDKL